MFEFLMLLGFLAAGLSHVMPRQSEEPPADGTKRI